MTIRRIVVIVATLFTVFAPITSSAADTVEFLNGSKATGTVKSIRKADKEFEFETKVGTRTFARTYSFSKVHAVTMNGERFELTPKTDIPSTTNGQNESPKRTVAEVQAAIRAAGNTPPEWFDATSLNYPKTLDLSWPLKRPTKGWHAQKNMSQYIWSVINENPSRWHSGIKLVHHCTTLHKDNTTLLQRDMQKLGTMYFTLLQDYSRAAFWYQKANPPVSQVAGVRLAECYWRIGNRRMALNRMRGKSLAMDAIKLYGDMGETDLAVRHAERFKNYSSNSQAFLMAGDALRQTDRLDEAVKYYQRVIDCDNFRDEDYENRMKGRARDSVVAIRLYDKAEVSKVANGTYRDNSIGYNGRLDIEVTVDSGKIQRLQVTAHKEKQYYAALTDTPDQIIRLQSIQGVDATSGATITSQAIVNATAKALAKGVH